MVSVWHRIRKGVAGIGDTEWALLGFETVGIVFGVLLAVQVGNWIEDRKEAREQRELIERLFEESQDVVAYARADRDQFEAVQPRQIAALDALVNSGNCPDRSGWYALSMTRFFPALSPPSAAYEEMIGSGGLGRLKDPDLIRAVSTYHSSFEEYTRQQDFFRDASIARGDRLYDLMPMEFDGETGVVGYRETGFESACASDDVKIDLISAYRSSAVIHNWRQGLAADAIRMCGALGRAVGKECVPTSGDPLSGDDLKIAQGEESAPS